MRCAQLLAVGAAGPLAACLRSEPIDLGARADSAAASGETQTSRDTAAASDASGPLDATEPEVEEAVATAEACALTWPVDHDFGPMHVGACEMVMLDVRGTCGATPAALISMTWESGADPAFQTVSPAAPPIAIETFGPLAFVEYCPAVVGATSRATLTVVVAPAGASAADPRAVRHQVAYTGRALRECPSIVVDEGTHVVPQTVLHLHASDAADPDVAYAWRVFRPAGAVSRLMPSAADVNPIFEADVAGEYQFELTTTDAHGDVCQAPMVTVDVVPAAALHIELLWHTPGDPNESDEGDGMGADLDLHLLCSDPGGHFFDGACDTFYRNASPNWGGFDTADDPHLDRDDTDGAGPENLNIEQPAAGCHTIGVHVYEDWGYGPSVPTVRVYGSGALVFEATGAGLVTNDLWTVTSVCWPIDSAPVVRHVCAGTSTPCASADDCSDGGACGLDVVQRIP